MNRIIQQSYSKLQTKFEFKISGWNKVVVFFDTLSNEDFSAKEKIAF
jgi:hypothetical protein